MDSNDITFTMGKLADYNGMAVLGACNWDTGRSAGELLCFVSTARYVNEFLTRDLAQAMDARAASQPPTAAKRGAFYEL